MLNSDQIANIAAAAANRHLPPRTVERVLVEGMFYVPTTDSPGEDGLRITIVIPPGAAETISGDQALDTLVEIKQRLRNAGEERQSIVEYATEAELASDDTES